jgi:hypothetical protein
MLLVHPVQSSHCTNCSNSIIWDQLERARQRLGRSATALLLLGPQGAAVTGFVILGPGVALDFFSWQPEGMVTNCCLCRQEVRLLKPRVF